MKNRITAPEQYQRIFKDEVRTLALECALDIRKFEIDLYWKRTAYFWTLIAAAFAGYFVLVSNKKDEAILIFLIGCIGLVLSTGWYLVNRGSKYWQENWERHVDALEDEVVGPLYKTTISKQKFPWLKIFSGYRYSVSNINQIISLFVTALWIGITLSSFLELTGTEVSKKAGVCAIAGLTTLFIGLLLVFGCSRPQRDRDVDFHMSELVDAENTKLSKVAEGE